MDKIIQARKLLEQKVMESGFADDIYTLTHDKISGLIAEVEKELNITDDDTDDGTRWYDDIRQDMMDAMYERYAKWLMGES